MVGEGDAQSPIFSISPWRRKKGSKRKIDSFFALRSPEKKGADSSHKREREKKK